MDLIGQAWAYVQTHPNELRYAFIQHMQNSITALLIAIVISAPLGILTSRYGRSAQTIINVIGILRVLPSIAVLLALLPVFKNDGVAVSIVALTLLACPPILINTDAGLRGVSPAVKEAARGMGMTWFGSLLSVELPLALPVLIGGIRTATIEVIASATLATYVGGGGFGDIIAQGLAGFDNAVLIVGALPVAVIALLAEFGLASLQRAATPKVQGRVRVA